jgi:hypothetical protein
MEATSDLFEQLPKEIKLAICDYLLPNDLSRACCVCSKWNLLMGSDLLWRKFVLAKKSGKNSGTSIVQDKQEAKPFKWIYIVGIFSFLKIDEAEFQLILNVIIVNFAI